MDIVALLEKSASELPKGDYTVGLHAIVRHVKAAIRHLERDQVVDPDTCTDAIYRTNQAYEGSLKEAYRALAGKDPAGVSPFEIEKYLENNSVVRPRVLTQLTRYRQDYRNPSTHDYKLDFDSDEALLAIVSVCGFAKLLINQIASRIASQVAQAKVAARHTAGNVMDVSDVAAVCLAYTRESASVGWFEYEDGLASALRTAGFDATCHLTMDGVNDKFWDLTVAYDGKLVGIDSRPASSGRSDGELFQDVVYQDMIGRHKADAGILILRAPGIDSYSLYKVGTGNTPAFVICDATETAQIEAFQKDNNTFDPVDLQQ